MAVDIKSATLLIEQRMRPTWAANAKHDATSRVSHTGQQGGFCAPAEVECVCVRVCRHFPRRPAGT